MKHMGGGGLTPIQEQKYPPYQESNLIIKSLSLV